MHHDDGILPELRLLIIILSFCKIMFFVRINQHFGSLVLMVRACIIDLYPFIVSFTTFILLFSAIFLTLGMDIDEEVITIQGLSDFQLRILQTFRNSIGEPSILLYSKHLAANQDPWQQLLSTTRINLIWIVWYMQTFFMLVIMLNFIIAVITDTHSRVSQQ